MSKKILKVIENRKRLLVLMVTSLLVICLIIAGITFYPFLNKKISEPVEQYYENLIDIDGNKVGWSFIEKERSPYKIILCDFDLKSPGVILIDTGVKDEYLRIVFYELERNNLFELEWNSNPTKNGSTQVYNTTFSNLVSMAKDDCNQFKTRYTEDEGAKEGETTWRYYAPPTEEELKQQEEEARREEELKKEYVTFDDYRDMYNALSQEELDTIQEKINNGEFIEEYDVAEYLVEQGKTTKKLEKAYFYGDYSEGSTSNYPN